MLPVLVETLKLTKSYANLYANLSMRYLPVSKPPLLIPLKMENLAEKCDSESTSK